MYLSVCVCVCGFKITMAGPASLSESNLWGVPLVQLIRHQPTSDSYRGDFQTASRRRVCMYVCNLNCIMFVIRFMDHVCMYLYIRPSGGYWTSCAGVDIVTIKDITAGYDSTNPPG